MEVHCRSVLDVPVGQTPYEALYYIGYNREHDRYVMHLLDTFGVAYSTFGVAYSPIPGIGERQGNRIPFVFEYPSGPFTNTFTWHPETQEWTHLLESLDDGVKQVFATKRMRRI